MSYCIYFSISLCFTRVKGRLRRCMNYDAASCDSLFGGVRDIFAVL